MGKYPILKPREVVQILDMFASRKSGNAARTNNFGMQMDA